MKLSSRIFSKIGLTSKITRGHLEKFIKKYQSDGLTLDIGCGASPYVKYFPNRIGLDIKKAKEVDIVGNIYQLPFGDKKFDNILCTEVLEHLYSPEEAIEEMRRVLKKRGLLILSTRFSFLFGD